MEIAGIIYKSPTLRGTDGTFGALGTIYPGAGGGLELDGAQNYFTLSVGDNARTLTFQSYVPHDLDQMRILFAVPEPSS